MSFSTYPIYNPFIHTPQKSLFTKRCSTFWEPDPVLDPVARKLKLTVLSVALWRHDEDVAASLDQSLQGRRLVAKVGAVAEDVVHAERLQ